MALATPRNLSDSKTLKLAVAAVVTAYEVVLNNGQVLVAVNDTAISVDNVYVYNGPVEFPKLSTDVMAPGDVVYWDDTAKNITLTVGANTKVGIVTEAAGNGVTEVEVALSENK